MCIMDLKKQRLFKRLATVILHITIVKTDLKQVLPANQLHYVKTMMKKGVGREIIPYYGATAKKAMLHFPHFQPGYI